MCKTLTARCKGIHVRQDRHGRVHRYGNYQFHRFDSTRVHETQRGPVCSQNRICGRETRPARRKPAAFGGPLDPPSSGTVRTSVEFGEDLGLRRPEISGSAVWPEGPVVCPTPYPAPLLLAATKTTCERPTLLRARSSDDADRLNAGWRLPSPQDTASSRLAGAAACLCRERRECDLAQSSRRILGAADASAFR